MTSNAKTVAEYVASLPEDRRAAISTVRAEILKNLPKGCQEGMLYGMIGYYVPHSIFPQGYHCDPKQPLCYAGLASQKNHMAVYLTCVYADPESMAEFVEQYKKSGKKMDMGKSCVRFTKLENLPLDVIGRAIGSVSCDEFVASYVKARAEHIPRKR